MGVAGITWPNFEILGHPNNFWTKTAIRFKLGTGIEDDASLRMDHKTTNKWAWLGSSDLISYFLDPLNKFWTNWAIRNKFSTETEDGPLQRKEYKTAPRWMWLGHMTQFRHCWPLITFERIESYPLQIWYRDGGRTRPA